MNFKEACLETVRDVKDLTVDLFLNGKILNCIKDLLKFLICILSVAAAVFSVLILVVGTGCFLILPEEKLNPNITSILYVSAITCVISSFFWRVLYKMGWAK